MIKLTTYNIIQMQRIIISRTGGAQGIRDNNLLDSAIHTAYQTFDHQELYKTVEEKSARMCYGLISNHPFVDGNKRIGILVMLTNLKLNGITLNISNIDLINIGFSLAKNETSYDDLVKWIFIHKTKNKSPEHIK